MASSIGFSDFNVVSEALKEEEKRPNMEHSEAHKSIELPLDKAEYLL